jgi:hypothetical protein
LAKDICGKCAKREDCLDMAKDVDECGFFEQDQFQAKKAKAAKAKAARAKAKAAKLGGKKNAK